MNLGAGPVNVGQIGIDQLRGGRSRPSSRPIPVEKIVSVGPSSLRHHLASNEQLIRVSGAESYCGVVDGALVQSPARHGIGAVYGDGLPVVRGDRDPGIGRDCLAIRSRSNRADLAVGSRPGTMFNREIGLSDRSWITVATIGRHEAHVGWNAATYGKNGCVGHPAAGRRIQNRYIRVAGEGYIGSRNGYRKLGGTDVSGGNRRLATASIPLHRR